MDCSMPGLPAPHHLPEFSQVHVHCVSDALQPSPVMPSSPSALSLSQHQGLFQRSAVCIRWPKYWSFSFSISPSNEYSGMISLKIDWFDLLAVQGTFKSSPTSQFEGINSLALSFLCGAALTTTCDHREDHSLDYTDLCQQSNVSAFQHCLDLSSLSCQEAIIFWLHGCSRHPQWFWSPGRGNLFLLSPLPLLFAMQ